MSEDIVKIIRIDSEDSEKTVRDLKTSINELRDALVSTEEGTEEYTKTLQKLTEKQQKLQSVMSAGKKEFNNSRTELRNLKNELDNLQEGTDEYNAAFQRAAEITHTLSERQQLLRYSSADLGQQLDNVISIGTSLAGAFNSVNAIMALTGKKSEDLQKVMVKLQAGIALVQGLKGLQGMGKRMEGLVNGITAFIFGTNKATAAVTKETAAVTSLTTAQKANTVATAGATVATNAFKKALVATGIGAIVVLLGTLIAHWETVSKVMDDVNKKLGKSTDTFGELKKEINGVSKVFKDNIIPAIVNTVAAVQELTSSLKSLLTFNFKEFGEKFKQGANLMGEGISSLNFKDIADNYKEGYNSSSGPSGADILKNLDPNNIEKSWSELSSESREKAWDEVGARIEKKIKDYNNEIEDHIAKYGSEWKYMEENLESWKYYYEVRTMYAENFLKDEDEVNKVQREQWEFEREYNKRRTAEEEEEKENALKEKEKMFAQEKQMLLNNLSVADTEFQKMEEALNKIGEINQRIADENKSEEQREMSDLNKKYAEELKLFIQYNEDTTALTDEYEKKKDEIRRKYRTQEALEIADNNIRKSGEKNAQEVAAIEIEYSLREADGSWAFNDIIEQIDRIYEANRTHLDELANEYQSLMDNPDLSYDARLEAEENYYATLQQMRELDLKHQIDKTNAEKKNIKDQVKAYSDYARAIGSIYGDIADTLEQDIRNKVENGDITEKQGERQFQWVKGLKIAESTINTITGAIAAYMSCQESFPQPYATILGAIQAATVTAAGLMQIQKIKATQLNAANPSTSDMGSAVSSSAAMTVPEEYVPQYYRNATGESELVRLTDSIRDQKVYVLESDITDAQDHSKRVRVESTF